MSERGDRIDIAEEARALLGSSTKPRLFVASTNLLTMIDVSSPTFAARSVPLPDGFRFAAWTPARDGSDSAAAVLLKDGASWVARLGLADDTPTWSTPVATGLDEYFTVESRGQRAVVFGRRHTGGAGTLEWTLSVVRDGTATLIPLPERSSPSGLIALVDDQLFVPDENGTFLVLDLSDVPRWLAPMRPQLGGRAPFSLWGVDVAGESLLLLGLVGHDRLVAMAPDGTVRWNVLAGVNPSLFVLDEPRHHAFVVDAQRTGIEVVDFAEGRSVHRIPFDFALGDSGGTFQALTWDAPRRRVLAVSQRWKSLLALDATTLAPLPGLLLDASASPPRGISVAPNAPHDVWVAHEWELGRIPGGEGPEELVVEELPRRGKFVLPLPDGRVVVGMLDRIALVDPEADPGERIVGAVSFDAPIDRVAFDGTHVLVSWSNDSGDIGFSRITPDKLARSSAPATVPSSVFGDRTMLLGFLLVDDGYLVLATSPASDCAALFVDRAFTPVGSEPCPVTVWGALTPTPDGRRFYWAEATYISTVLQETRLEEDQPIATLRSHRVEGELRSIAFDPSGERGVALAGGAEALFVIE